MLRILHIIPSLARHGTAKQLRIVAEGLARAGVNVHVCVLAGGERASEWCASLAAHGVEATVLTHRMRSDASCLPALCGKVRSIRPQIVHTWLAAGNLFGCIAALAGGAKDLVISLRDRDPFAPRWLALAERWIGGAAKAIVVNSHGVRDFAARRGLDTCKIRVIPNAVEPAATSRYTREEVFDLLNLPHDARLLGTIGALARSKNLKHLIWVADIFQAIHEPVHLLILGDGPQRARLERFARQIEVDRRVHFLGHRDDVLNILPHLDVYVSGSQHEGCPNGLLEAMAAGVPPVVTDIHGHRELVCHGQSGYLVPVGSRADVARCAKKLLDDDALAEELGNSARTSVLANHSVSDAVEQYRALYLQIAG